MSVDYSLALSRSQYDEEVEKFRCLAIAGSEKHRDDLVNLCSIGYDGSDIAKILIAFDGDKMDEAFITKIHNLLVACGTAENWEINAIVDWMKHNLGQSYVLICE